MVNTAKVEVQFLDAAKLLKKGKLKIGWSRTRVNLLKKQRIECYWCLQYRHMASDSQQPYRS